jgi:phospholipid/cholesterol/gamma-HCH transport system substrate-binding protein
MNTTTNHRIKLGMFLFTGSILLVVGLYMIGKNKSLFGSSYTLIAHFDQISGLQPGNNIRYSGIDIGTVEDIQLLNDTTIEVTMTIAKKMAAIIRTNSIASIGTDGLMGNKLINIEPGTFSSPMAQEGEILPSIKSVDTEAMLRTLQSTNTNVERISNDLMELTMTINKSRGTLYTMLLDTNLALGLENTLSNVEKISIHLNSFSSGLAKMSSDIQHGKGAIGALLNDTGSVVLDLEQTMRNLHSSSEKIDKTATSLNSLMQEAKEGNGSLTVILRDTVTANHLKRALEYIDSSAYNLNLNMEALKHTFLMRKYFKKSKSNQ